MGYYSYVPPLCTLVKKTEKGNKTSKDSFNEVIRCVLSYEDNNGSFNDVILCVLFYEDILNYLCTIPESTKELLKWKPELADIADQSGCTPLHCAASFDHPETASLLLDLHNSVAYATTKNGEKNTALHIAAKRGKMSMASNIISEYPTCAEIVNSKGHNVLHVAAENKQLEVVREILKSLFLSTRSFLNQEDNEGNTPLHLLAASDFFFKDLVMHPEAEIKVFNNNNQTPFDIARKLFEEGTTHYIRYLKVWKRVGALSGLRHRLNEVDNDQNSSKNPATDSVSQVTSTNKDREMERLWRQVDVRMVVAALIVTVTFTAGFTMPGGFIGSDGPTQGLAALRRLAAFRAFVISDALSLIMSSIALFIYFWEVGDSKEADLIFLTEFADQITSFAILAMMVAFMTGTYAVLEHSSSIGIAVLVLCSCFCAYFLILTSKLYGSKREGKQALDNLDRDM